MTEIGHSGCGLPQTEMSSKVVKVGKIKHFTYIIQLHMHIINYQFLGLLYSKVNWGDSVVFF